MKKICLMLMSGLLIFSTNAIAEKKRVADSTIGIGYPIEEPVISCKDELKFYELSNIDVDNIIPDEIKASIADILSSAQTCEIKLEGVRLILEQFWATDPWCRRDRQTFVEWLATNSGNAIPTEVKNLIDNLLSSPNLQCYEGLSASQSITKHFIPSYNPYPIGVGIASETSSAKSLVDYMNKNQTIKKNSRCRVKRKRSRS
jgi:hypothetical protein